MIHPSIYNFSLAVNFSPTYPFLNTNDTFQVKKIIERTSGLSAQ